MANPNFGSNVDIATEEDEVVQPRPKPTAASKPAPARAAAAAPATKTADPGMERVRIILERSQDIPPTGLPIGLNGNVILIRPGEPVDIPKAYLAILDEAITSAPIQDPATGQIVGHEDRQRFPYRYV